MTDNCNTTPWYNKPYDTDKIVKGLMHDGSLLNKHIDAEGFFKDIIKGLVNKPLWIKQAIYFELREDIKSMTNLELLESIDKNDLLQLYVPQLSILGKTTLREGTGDPIVLDFVRMIDGRKNVIDVCFENGWTLKNFAEMIIHAEEMGYIEKIRSSQVLNVFKYVAEQMDICTLLVKLEEITPEQYSFAQFSLSEMNRTFDIKQDASIEDVLVRMNYITKDQLNSLLILKEASVIEYNQSTSSIQDSQVILELQENIDELAFEKHQVELELETVRPMLEARDRKIKDLEEQLKTQKDMFEQLKISSEAKKGGIFDKL